jgi:WD40 repeat protein
VTVNGKKKFVDAVYKEIVDMQLIWEPQMIHLLYCDHKTIYIYDEEPEESVLLRTMTGANPNDSITKLRYNHHLSLIASGSSKGRVALWDYEIGNLLGYCSGHSADSEITAIEFCSPRPIMITCGSDGRVMLWTVRPAPYVNLHICVAQFDNMTFTGQIEESTSICSMAIVHQDMSGVERGFPLFHY